MRVYKIVLVVFLFVAAGNASAQFLGQMSPASIVETETGKAGGYFILADDAVAIVGSVRYGLSQYTEGRFRLGLLDPDGKDADPGVIVGADIKYLLWEYIKPSGTDSTGTTEYNNPFDLSLGGAVEYAKMDYGGILGIGGSFIASAPYKLRNRSVIEPYARLNIRFEHVQLDKQDDESDIEIGLNLGALFSVTPLIDFTAEFQLDDQNAFMLGVDVVAF